jgi:hypothetical protein
MKKKIIYPLISSILIISCAFILVSMTKKSTKNNKKFGTTFTVVNHSSIPWTSITLGNDIIYPNQLPYNNFPTTDDFTVSVHFSSSFTGAIQIVDANLNPLACSPSGTGTTRNLLHCLGSSTTAQLDIYSGQGCP